MYNTFNLGARSTIWMYTRVHHSTRLSRYATISDDNVIFYGIFNVNPILISLFTKSSIDDVMNSRSRQNKEYAAN